jgi:hypothetical protein
MADAPKCANDACTKRGVERCAVCKGVMYCSAACWPEGAMKGPHRGPHKKSSTTAGCAPMAAEPGGGSWAGACIICLSNGDPLPIQSGCACRGDAGLAHVECRAEAAAHCLEAAAHCLKNNVERWVEGARDVRAGRHPLCSWDWRRRGGRKCAACPEMTRSGWLLTAWPPHCATKAITRKPREALNRKSLEGLRHQTTHEHVGRCSQHGQDTR